MTRQIHFNAFAMNTVGHQSPGLWRHPEDRSAHYRDLRHWTELAALLEKGVFDGIFLADVLGTYDLYGGDSAESLRAAAQVPINDPMMLVSAMALVTEHLGFGVTANTSAEHPFPFARRMSTLDHLTEGRIGWNVVTGYLDSAARNMGATQREHDLRYDHADEYLDVVRKLWESSWEDAAVVRDAQANVFTDPAKVHPIEHHGRFFDVPGFHLCEPSPQRTPVIYQAGSSPRGMEFAAKHAEAVFVGASGPASLATAVARVRAALVAAGRDPYSARVYTKLTIVTDSTPEAAREKYADYVRYADPEGALALVSGWMGQDLSRYDLDQPSATSPATRSTPMPRPSPAPTTTGCPGRCATSARSPRSAGSGCCTSGRGPRSPTGSSSSSRRPTSTASTSPTRSRPARSPTWSSTWCRSCRRGAPTPRRTLRGRCATSCSVAATGCPRRGTGHGLPAPVRRPLHVLGPRSGFLPASTVRLTVGEPDQTG
jgi:FMN-dependent oxidoreductase (nitrilotriacetate monooxygenase family)